MLVERGNVVLEIPDIEKTKYLSKGYSVVDGKGNIIERGEPKNGALRKEYLDLKEKYSKLKKDNEKLKAKIKAKKG